MENFNISRFFKVLLNSKLYVAFVLITFIAIGYFYSFYYVTPMYSSSATVMLVQNDNSSVEQSEDSITGADITLNQNLLSTYTKIAKSDRVLEQVIANLDLDMSIKDLANNVSVQSINNTEVFKVSVNNKDASLAANIANELVKVFSNEVQSLYNMNNVYLMDAAELNEAPINVNHAKDMIIFGAMGIMVAFGLVVVIYLFDTTIKTEQDIEEYTGLSVLSTIPMFKNTNNNELIVNEQPKSPIAECFKTFRTNVMFSIQNKALHTILVTSGFMAEGKSFVASNLAVTFAQSGKKVILVDTDMRKGRIHKIFKLSNEFGLSNCLAKIGTDGKLVNINEFIQKSGIPNLHVMTSGIVPPNPSELLSSPNMKKFLEALNSQYDVVICDGTPCMLVSDSVILSKMVDTTVIVTANKVTKLDTIIKIKKSIEIVGGNIGGAIINKMNVTSKSYHNKYYYGNHNETNTNMNFDENGIDNLLENVLCISDNIVIEDKTSDNLIDVSNKEANYNENINELSSMISDNSKEIAELKSLYKSAMQNTLDAISKNNSTNTIMNELVSLKDSYKANFDKQNAMIDELNNKVSNISNSNVMLELENIKNSYMDNINIQNDEFTKLSEKIENIDFNKYSNELLTELENTKSFYKETINSQNNAIASLEDKISSINANDNSEIILDELASIKDSYEMALNAQNDAITSLEDKVSTLIASDNSDIILTELESIRNNYKDAIDSQNDKIDIIDNKISNFNNNDNNSEILQEVSNIYKQLKNINSRFDYLERKANENEELIRKLNKTNAENISSTIDRVLDVNKLNDKVISIQDYLENEYANVAIPKSTSKHAINKDQINIVDDLLEKSESNTKTTNLENNIMANDNNTANEDKNNKEFVVDYDKVKTRQKRGLFSFRTKYIEPDYNDEDEITIVSQILA